MKNRSIYNMIMSIISGVSSLVLMILSIVFLSIKKDCLGVTLSSIYYPLLVVYFIIKSIYYGQDNSKSKRILNIISKILFSIIIILISTQIILRLNTPFSWILFSLMILLCISSLLFDIFKINIIKYILITIITFIILAATILIFNINSILLLISIFLLYISIVFGEIFENKLLLSFSLPSIILFGLFLILL